MSIISTIYNLYDIYHVYNIYQVYYIYNIYNIYNIYSVSVSHTDVSRPAAPVFAAVPVLQAKFPHDFFYPFVSSAAAADRARLLVKFCPFVTFTLSFLVPLLRL